MFKYNGFLQNAQNTVMDGFPNSYASIKVLIVDHKKDFLAYIGEVLHSCLFEVTCVDHSGAALRLLSENKNKFDLLLIDRDMSDVDVHTFLKLTINMDVPSVVMSEQEDDAFLFEAFKNGASHVLKKPISIDALRIIRQAVMRERMLKINDKCNNNNSTPAHEAAAILEKKSYGRKKRYHSSDQDDDDYNYETGGMKKKICVQWTPELHAKFLKVVRELGEGSCFPKDIQERMGVPGLTRMQVASHLQKCRKENLRSNQKQTMPTSSRNHTLPNNLFPQGVDDRKFGCMPSIPIDQNDQEESSTLIGINLSINGWQKEMNNNTYRSASMMNISNQRNIEKCTQYVPIPFASDLSSNQDDGFGSKASMITTSCTNYFQQELPGVRDAGQGFDQHTFPSIRSPTSEGFPDFLRDSDGNGPNDI